MSLSYVLPALLLLDAHIVSPGLLGSGLSTGLIQSMDKVILGEG